MEITHITRTNMKSIDSSENVRYSAKCDELLLMVNFMTDGIFHKHMTLEEWTLKAKQLFSEKIKKDNGI
jgi:hypothetical protein